MRGVVPGISLCIRYIKLFLFSKRIRETARHITRGLEIVGPQCVQKRVARRARSSEAEADMDEFRAGIHHDRGFGNDFRDARG